MYFSGVRAPCIEQRLQGLLLKFLRLQAVIEGMKRMQGSTSSLAHPLPITSCLLFGNLWTRTFMIIPCSGQHPGFLRVSVFTVPNLNSFSIALHISVQDVAVDCLASPSFMLVRIKASNTDPTWIYTLAWTTALSARWRVMTYFSIRGDGPGPLFPLQDGHSLSCSPLTDWLWRVMSATGTGTFRARTLH